jgi:hypothetical protein
MNYKKLLKISGIAIIIALLFTVIPALPIMATDSMSISPTQAKIGETITVYGAFTPSPTERWASVYLSPNNLAPLESISSMTTYEYIGGADIPITGQPNAGNFTLSFTIPSSLVDGSVDQYVTAGTYYVYIVVNPPATVIGTKASLTIVVPTLDTPSPASGPAGTSVLLTGSNFPASTALVFKFDTTVITPTSGHTSTLSTGLFLSYITIPSTATAGVHTISVTAGTNTANVSFTVTASASLSALQPSTGPPGTLVAVSGSNFPPSTAIILKFDTATLTPTGSTSTGTGGSFASIITIPSTATVGAHTISVTVGVISRNTTFTVTGTSPTINTITPTSGPPNTTVSISGSHFAASTTLTFQFDTATLTPTGSTSTDSSGNFTSSITVPSSASVGTHTITVTAGSTTDTATFTVTEAATTTPPTTNIPLSLNQSGDTIGSLVGIGGSGFLPDSPIVITYDGEQIAQTESNETGFFVVTFEVPPSQYGAHTIIATDGVNTGNTTYTVESISPDVPQPLLPAMGEAISLSAKFDWDDATDNSSPVTYNMQIATSDTFAADTIVINKIGLTQSEYILTEAEQLLLSSEGTYYWREQAVDAAFNESTWTGAGEFTIIQPFDFVGWPLYLTISLGGVVLFLLGLWVGRRTAFYY